MSDTILSFSCILADVILHQSYRLILLLSHFTDEQKELERDCTICLSHRDRGGILTKVFFLQS